VVRCSGGLAPSVERRASNRKVTKPWLVVVLLPDSYQGMEARRFNTLSTPQGLDQTSKIALRRCFASMRDNPGGELDAAVDERILFYHGMLRQMKAVFVAAKSKQFTVGKCQLL